MKLKDLETIIRAKQPQLRAALQAAAGETHVALQFNLRIVFTPDAVNLEQVQTALSQIPWELFGTLTSFNMPFNEERSDLGSPSNLSVYVIDPDTDEVLVDLGRTVGKEVGSDYKE